MFLQLLKLCFILTAATVTYWIFGGGMDLYDFTILFPVIFASLSAIVIFALVRVIGGTTAGLFSALLFSVSITNFNSKSNRLVQIRTFRVIFWFTDCLFFLSGINSEINELLFKTCGSRNFYYFFNFSMGWKSIFYIPIRIFFLTLPFLRKDHKFIIWAIPLYTITTILVSLGFERVSSNFIFGIGGISLIIPTLFLILCIIIQNKSSKNKTRNGLILLLALLVIAPTVILVVNSDSQFLPLPSHRYLNALNPFLTTTDPLVDSVSEHATTTIQQSFLFHSVLMIFSGVRDLVNY